LEERRHSQSEPGTPPPVQAPPPATLRTVALVVILSAFWFVLSGRFGLQYLIFLAASVGVVLWLNPERPFRGLDPSRGGGMAGLLRGIPALARYLVWLVWNIILANIEVARLILHPRMPINPALVTFETRLRDPMARVVVANTITLTPGTVTIDLEDQSFLVHALVPESAEAILSGALQNVVGAIFGEARDPAPELRTIERIEDFQP
jgi:multicomponent Na+:H+ antiporter subunit E